MHFYLFVKTDSTVKIIETKHSNRQIWTDFIEKMGYAANRRLGMTQAGLYFALIFSSSNFDMAHLYQGKGSLFQRVLPV